VLVLLLLLSVLTFLPKQPSIGRGISRSTDGGGTWDEATLRGLPDRYIRIPAAPDDDDAGGVAT